MKNNRNNSFLYIKHKLFIFLLINKKKVNKYNNKIFINFI